MTFRQHACILTYAVAASMCGVRAADSLPASPTGDTKAFLVSIDVYRVQPEAALDKVTLRAPEATLKSEPKDNAPNHGTSGDAKPRYSMTFREAEFTAKGLTLRATADGWTWNDKPEPPAGAAIEKIAAPKICALPAQEFSVFIGSEIPIQYFEKTPQGLFALKELKEWTGVKLKAAVEPSGEGEVLIRDLSVQVRTVGARVPLEGVKLDVGPPVVAASELTTTVKAPRDCYTGLIFGGESQGVILLRVKVSAAPAAEKPGDGATPRS